MEHSVTFFGLSTLLLSPLELQLTFVCVKVPSPLAVGALSFQAWLCHASSPQELPREHYCHIATRQRKQRPEIIIWLTHCRLFYSTKCVQTAQRPCKKVTCSASCPRILKDAMVIKTHKRPAEVLPRVASARYHMFFCENSEKLFLA